LKETATAETATRGLAGGPDTRLGRSGRCRSPQWTLPGIHCQTCFSRQLLPEN